MLEMKNKILKELAELEDKALNLRATATQSGKQTDLEVAILSEQVRLLRQKNENASDLIDKSISILKNLK